MIEPPAEAAEFSNEATAILLHHLQRALNFWLKQRQPPISRSVYSLAKAKGDKIMIKYTQKQRRKEWMKPWSLGFQTIEQSYLRICRHTQPSGEKNLDILPIYHMIEDDVASVSHTILNGFSLFSIFYHLSFPFHWGSLELCVLLAYSSSSLPLSESASKFRMFICSYLPRSLSSSIYLQFAFMHTGGGFNSNTRLDSSRSCWVEAN